MVSTTDASDSAVAAQPPEDSSLQGALPLSPPQPASEAPPAQDTATPSTTTALKEQHLVFQENQRGVSFDKLFGTYLAGATRITVTNPYLRLFHRKHPANPS